MVKIAVTGGIACGKSSVGAVLREMEIAVCEADELAHALMSPGKPVFEAVVRAFGRVILGPDGSIDRQILGAKVFSDAEERARLDAIVHPRVKEAWCAWLGEKAHFAAAAVIIPLLYEVEEADNWDVVVCVTSSRPVQAKRLRARGFSEAEVERRIGAQLPVAVKAARADYVVVNNGTRDVLLKQTERVLERILEK